MKGFAFYQRPKVYFKITEYNPGFYISAPAMRLLGKPQTIELGINPGSNHVAIKAAKEDGFQVHYKSGSDSAGVSARHLVRQLISAGHEYKERYVLKQEKFGGETILISSGLIT